MLKRFIVFLVLSFVSVTNTYAETKVIHVLVALCDNKYQGIVPVPPAIGNGQDPHNNLYWGAGFGLKTYFNKQQDWELMSSKKNTQSVILERLVYRYKKKDIYLIADAYDGKYITNTIQDFLNYSAGLNDVTITLHNKKLITGGKANLVIYVGHNALMDWSLSNIFNPPSSPIVSQEQRKQQSDRQVAVFACKSQQYFSKPLEAMGISPAMLTTHYMAPEGYVVYALVNGYVNNLSKQQTHENVAKAYSKYQKLKQPAIKLFTTEYQ